MAHARTRFRTIVRIPEGEGVSLATARLALWARAWMDAEGGELLLLTGEAKGRKTAPLLEELSWLGVSWEGLLSAPELASPSALREARASWLKSRAAHSCACPLPSDRPCPCSRGEAPVEGKALRLRTPASPLVVKDRVLGTVHIPPAQVGGVQLLDPDGSASPLVEEAVVLMKAHPTHLLTDASPRRAAALNSLLKACGAEAPELAHLPPLKVAGGTTPDLGALRQAGFLPGVLREALLGAGLPQGKRPSAPPKRGAFGTRAALSLKKLKGCNRTAIQGTDLAFLSEAVAPPLVAAGLLPADWAEEETMARFVRGLASYLKGRIHLLSEAVEVLAPVFCYDPERIAPCGQAALAEPEAARALCAFAEKVEASNLRQHGAYGRISRVLAGHLGMTLSQFERYLAAGLIGRAKPAELRALLPLLADGCALDLPSGVAGPVERAWDAYYRLALPHS